MSRKQRFLTLPRIRKGDDLIVPENSRPLPEEGRRLMLAFLQIREAHLREALVTFAEELARSTRGRD